MGTVHPHPWVAVSLQKEFHTMWAELQELDNPVEALLLEETAGNTPAVLRKFRVVKVFLALSFRFQDGFAVLPSKHQVHPIPFSSSVK